MRLTSKVIEGSELPEYAGNAEAITGGLSVGSFYHTAGVVKVVV